MTALAYSFREMQPTDRAPNLWPTPGPHVPHFRYQFLLECSVKLNVNDKVHDIDVPPDMPLLWVIRDVLGLSGTKFGCGVAQCGACTVWRDGRPIRSCATPVKAVGESVITTIEHIDALAEARAVQQQWAALDVPQCGYCQSGQVMSAVALLRMNPKPADRDIDLAMNGNLCRCATYVRIRGAIHAAAMNLAASKEGA